MLKESKKALLGCIGTNESLRDSTKETREGIGTFAEQTARGTVKKVGDKIHFKMNPKLKALTIMAIVKIYNTYQKTVSNLHEPSHDNEKGNDNGKLKDTVKGRLIDDEGNIPKKVNNGDVVRAVTECLDLVVNVYGDSMFEDFKHRNFCKYTHIAYPEVEFSDENSGEGKMSFNITGGRPLSNDEQVQIIESYSGFTIVEYEILSNLFPFASSPSEMIQLAISAVIFIAARIDGAFNAHLISAGSKAKMIRGFHLENLTFDSLTPKLITYLAVLRKFPVAETNPMAPSVINMNSIKFLLPQIEELPIMVDPNTRTGSVVFNSLPHIAKAYCGDKDIRFFNFFDMLKRYPVALTLLIKSLLTESGILSGKLENAELLYEYAQKETEKSEGALKGNKRISIEYKLFAAAYLFLAINFSYRGYEKGYAESVIKGLITKFERIMYDLIYTSYLFPIDNFEETERKSYIKVYSYKGLVFRTTNESNVGNGKLVYIVPISYEHWDYFKAINRFINNPNVIFIYDPPYLRLFGIPCLDYTSKFTRKDFIKVIKENKKIRGKAILFHSENLDVQSMLINGGFKLIGKCPTGEKKTNVFTFNVGEPENVLMLANNKEKSRLSNNEATNDSIGGGRNA